MTVQSGRHQATHATGGREASRAKAGEAAAGAAASPAFVGRDDAFARVAEGLDHGPALVLIEGEAGIGKTRLLHEVLAARTRQRGSTGSALQKVSSRRQDGAARPDSPTRQESVVLVAACPPLQEPFPLGTVVDGLRRLGYDIGSVELSPLGGALRPLIPEWAGQLPPALEPIDDPKETRHRLFRALAELIDRIGVEILVVEDAHWADTSTLELLLTLTAAGEHRMSVVVTYRPTDVPDGSLLLRLTAHPPAGMNHVRIKLEPLGVTEARQMVGSMFGTDEVSEKFAAFLHERADGIPLAIEESVRLLRDRHDIVQHEGRWTRRLLDELEVPPTVRDSVLERVARQPPESRQVLDAAAVLAAPADEALLTTVAGLDEQQGEHGVAAALASGLLREASPGRFTFRHVLDAQAVGEAIPASRWRRVHVRAAEALRTVKPEPVARLARHYREAGDTEAWCHYAEASADLASESGDDHTAVTVLLNVLTSVAHQPGRKARLARKLGQIAHYGTDPLGVRAEQVSGAIRAALAGGDIPRAERGEIRLLESLLWLRIGEYNRGQEQLEAAIPDVKHRPELAVRAMLGLAMPRTLSWPLARHREWLERASALLPHIESPLERLRFAMNHTSVLLMLGDEAGWEAAAEIPQQTSSRLEQLAIIVWRNNLAWAATLWGRYDEARAQLDTATELMQKAGDLGRMITARVARTYVDWYTGAWESVRITLRELAESDDALPIAELELRAIQGQLCLVGADRSTAEQRLREVSEGFAGRGVAVPWAVPPTAALGRLRLADGAAQDALELTTPIVATIARKSVWVWVADIAPVHLDALIATGKVSRAEAFVERFAAGLAGRDAPAPAASLALCQAIVTEAHSDHEGAAELFAEAAAVWATLPRPYDELLALERQGQCLLRAGDEDAGLAVLFDTEQRLRELGAKWDADRVAQVLRQHGVEVSRAWKRGRRGYGGQLSPREKEVLVLVARGMTNREAGEVLFLSPKTVGGHLSSAMRKLHVSSRTAAAVAAVEAGLISPEGDTPVN